MGVFAPIAAIGSAVAGGLSSIASGNAQNAAMQERALELKQQRELVQTQAKEQQASRLEQLNRTIGAITAITASHGLSVDSPSAQAVAGQRKKAAATDVGTIGANAAIQSGMLSESARAAIMAGQNAQMNGWFQAVSDVGKAFG